MGVVNFDWTDERVESLTRLWADGISATIIGSRMGCSRNAVIGKAYRLNLPSRVTSVKLAGRRHLRRYTYQPRKLKPERKIRLIPSYAMRDSMGAPLLAAPLPPRSETDIARVSFADMEPRLHCRFIPDDPGDNFSLDKPMYCGLPPVLGLPYCMAHGVRCHNPPELKVRVRVASKVKEFA